jgi:hypothetical protein
MVFYIIAVQKEGWSDGDQKLVIETQIMKEGNRVIGEYYHLAKEQVSHSYFQSHSTYLAGQILIQGGITRPVDGAHGYVLEVRCSAGRILQEKREDVYRGLQGTWHRQTC